MINLYYPLNSSSGVLLTLLNHHVQNNIDHFKVLMSPNRTKGVNELVPPHNNQHILHLWLYLRPAVHAHQRPGCVLWGRPGHLPPDDGPEPAGQHRTLADGTSSWWRSDAVPVDRLWLTGWSKNTWNDPVTHRYVGADRATVSDHSSSVESNRECLHW